jgi:hypothetical protein
MLRSTGGGCLGGRGLTRQTSVGAASCGAGPRFQRRCHRRRGYSTDHHRSRGELHLTPGLATA